MTYRLFRHIKVSIHAPHEGERPSHSYMTVAELSFNPRSPRGGATSDMEWWLMQEGVSIHAPHEGERHPSAQMCRSRILCFNPRSPRGGATLTCAGNKYRTISFNPRSPRGGATIARLPPLGMAYSFNPRSPRGGATAEKCICMQHFREFTEYYPLRHGDACCIAPQDCIIQAFFGAKKRCFYVRLCFALKNKGVRG